MKTCSCGKRLLSFNKRGYCQSCAENRYCACGAKLSNGTRGDSCRVCSSRAVCIKLNTDPSFKPKRAATIAAWTPEQRKEKVRHLHEREIPPEEAARRRQQGLHLIANVLSRPDVRARTYAPETRARAGRKRTDSMLSWCPPELRDTYRHLLSSHYNAAEARALIEPEIPGTPANVKRMIANSLDAMQIKHERDLASRY